MTGRPPKLPRVTHGVVRWWCPCCKQWLEVPAFGLNRRTLNGLSSWCLRCCREDARLRRVVAVIEPMDGDTAAAWRLLTQ